MIVKTHELINVQQNIAAQINEFLKDKEISKPALIDIKYIVTDTPCKSTNALIIYIDAPTSGDTIVQVQEFMNVGGNSVGAQINRFLDYNQIVPQILIDIKYVVTDTQNRSVNALVIYEKIK